MKQVNIRECYSVILVKFKSVTIMIFDNMNYKIEDVDVKIGKQNKEMNKLLGKK